MSPVAPDPIRVLLYSHDSVGLGHIRRNLALAHALSGQLPRLTGREVTGMLVTGVEHGVELHPPAGFDVVGLPGVRKASGGYRPRHVQVPMADLTDLRGGMLRAVVRGFGPDLVVVDRHAFGVDGELRGALQDLREHRPETTVVLGLREVLDEPEAVSREWARLGDLSRVRALFDEIWVYGDERVHDIRRSGELPVELHDMVQYTGYLASGRHWVPEQEPTPQPYLLTMVGGGSDGMALCRTAAAAPVPAGYRHVVVTGPQMAGPAHREIERLAGPRTRVVTSVPDGLATIRGACAVVAMAGYNTVNEVMSTQTPALLVPRELPRKEQLIRAESLARAGAADLVRQEDLTPGRLGAWLAGAVHRTQPRSGLNLRGLAGVARRAAHLTGDRALTKEYSVVAS